MFVVLHIDSNFGKDTVFSWIWVITSGPEKEVADIFPRIGNQDRGWV